MDTSRLELTQGSTVAGLTSWTGSTVASATSPDGDYALQVCVVDVSYGGTCSVTAGVPAISSPTINLPYVVDSVEPVLDLGASFPRDGDHAIFASQPIVVRVTDNEGSGVLASGVSITLIDEAAGTQRTFSGAALTLDSTSQTFKTAAQDLILGHTYRLNVNASDAAGNLMSLAHETVANGGGFFATTFVAQPSAVTIPTTTCVLSSDVRLSDQTREARCDNVALNFADTSVAVGATKHTGSGNLIQVASLAPAEIKTTIAGVDLSQPAHESGDAAWGARTETMSFVLDASSSQPQTLPVRGRTIQLGTLTTRVPATWTQARLEMATMAAAGTTTCPDFTVEASPCSTDPIERSPVGETRYKSKIGVPGDGSGAPIVVTTRQTLDASGSVTSETLVENPTVTTVAGEPDDPFSDYACKESSQPEGFVVQQPLYAAWGSRSTSFAYDWGYFRYAYNNARQVDSVWKKQYERCAAGGGATYDQFRLDHMGLAMSIDQTTRYRINQKWFDKRAITKAEAGLGFSVGGGKTEVTINGGASSGSGGRWLGMTRRGPHAATSPEDWPENFVTGYWEEECNPALLGGCHGWHTGSTEWQGTTAHVLYEFVQGSVPPFWDHYEVYFGAHCGKPWPLGCGDLVP